MLLLQGVKACVAEELCQVDGSNNNTVLPTTITITSLRAAKSGKVVKVEAAAVARLAQALGAGRSHPKARSAAEQRSDRVITAWPGLPSCNSLRVLHSHWSSSNEALL